VSDPRGPDLSDRSGDDAGHPRGQVPGEDPGSQGDEHFTGDQMDPPPGGDIELEDPPRRGHVEVALDVCNEARNDLNTPAITRMIAGNIAHPPRRHSVGDSWPARVGMTVPGGSANL